MQNVFKYIILSVSLLGFVMVGIAFLGFNKLGKEHRKVSKDDFLLEHEKPIQNKNIIIMIIGLSLIMISILINGYIVFRVGM